MLDPGEVHLVENDEEGVGLLVCGGSSLLLFVGSEEQVQEPEWSSTRWSGG